MRLFSMIALLALLGTTAKAADGDYVFILKARGNPYWAAMVSGIEETAKRDGVQAVVYQLSDDKAAEEQLTLCNDIVQRKPKVLAVSSVTPAVGMQCLKQAAAAGIIVADMDATIPPSDTQKAGFALAYSVGSDNVLIGKSAAEYAATLQLGDAPHVLVLEGAAGSLPGTRRADGFRDTLKTLKPDAVVTSIAADWDRGKAMNATGDALQRDPQLALIYAANDLMALGAAEALKVAGKGRQVKIISVDGTTDGRQAVEEGRIEATVAQLPYLVGKRAVELAVEAVSTGKSGITEVTPTPILTRQSLNDKTNPDLQYVR